MALQLDGKVIVITGAASGIGLTTAKLLASRGAIISLADLNEKGLVAAVDSLPGDKHIYTVVNVTNSANVNAWIERTIKVLGKIDGAVNMAGVCTFDKPIKEESDEGWDLNMNVNARGTFFCIRAQLRNMKDGGSIVSAASVGGQMGHALFGAYCASKHAIIGLTRVAAKENPGLRLNCVAPGFINTPMTASSAANIDADMVQRMPQVQKRPGESIEVAHVVAFLLSDEASFVTGAVYNVDGGWFC